MRMSRSARAIEKSRGKTIADLSKSLKEEQGARRKADNASKRKDRVIERQKGQIERQKGQIRQQSDDNRRLAADYRAKDAEARRSNRRADRAEGALKKERERSAERGKEIRGLKRELYRYAGPHVPGPKTRKKRNEDRKRAKDAKEGGDVRKGAGDGDGGQPRRRPGGQPGRRATRRRFVPDQRVVIEKPERCRTNGCASRIRVEMYSAQTMYERPPPQRARTVESQCPHWQCYGCGDSGTATEGTAVPLHLFKAEKGDAEPERPAAAPAAPAAPADAGAAAGDGEPAAAAGGGGGGGQGGRLRQDDGDGDDEVVKAIREALGGGGDAGDAGEPVNDFPDDANKRFRIRHPHTGVLGLNVKLAVLKNWFNRLSVRMNQESLKDDGVEISSGQTSSITTKTGLALQPGLAALIALLAGASVIHSDKTSHRVNGDFWGLWVFFDPLRKIAVYWLSPDGDNAVLEKILAAWNGIIVCDGAPVFQKYRIQRCWAHILNEAKWYLGQFPDSESVRHVSDRLHKIFHDAKEFRGTHAERVRKRYEFTRRVRKIVDDYRDDPDLAEFMTKVGNAAYDLFLFVVLPWVPPTNNPAEKLLREPVVLRKIRGALRSVAGAMAFCALMSCSATWKMHGLRPLAEIRRVL